MKRRPLLRRIGATGVVAATLAGTSSGETAGTTYGIDREIAVDDVSGRVTLEELLDPRDVAALPDDVDPAARVFVIDEDADAITLDGCCSLCAKWLHDCQCDEGCCEASLCACPDHFC